MKYIATVDDHEFTIDVNDDGYVEIDGERYAINFQGLSSTSMYSLIIDGHSYDTDIEGDADLYHVMLKSNVYEVRVEDERTRRLTGVKGSLKEAVGEVLIKAPMPGVIVSILVSEGQTVAKNDVVIILESMKMQNEFKAPKDGVISSVRIKAGDKVDQNAIMLTISDGKKTEE